MAKRKRIIRIDADPPEVRNKKMEEEEDDVQYLPSEILLKVLETFPAQYLYDVVRCVSKQLAHDIEHNPKFIRSQLLHSDFAGFVTQNNFERSPVRLVELCRQRPGSELQFCIKNLGFKRGNMCDSCDGVLLMSSLVYPADLFLANPVTKQVRRLLDHPEQDHSFVYTKLGRIPETGVFKVVTVAKDYSSLLILTVGSHMSWRKVISAADFLLPEIFDNFENAVCVEGVMYWLADMSVFALDLCDESVHLVEFPEEFRDSPVKYHPLQMGKDICFIRFISMCMDILLLKDFKRNEWVLLERERSLFDFENGLPQPWLRDPLLYLESEHALLINCCNRRRISKAYPLGSNRYDKKVMAYNMVTGEREYLDVKDYISRTVKHTNSLVRL